MERQENKQTSGKDIAITVVMNIVHTQRNNKKKGKRLASLN